MKTSSSGNIYMCLHLLILQDASFISHVLTFEMIPFYLSAYVFAIWTIISLCISSYFLWTMLFPLLSQGKRICKHFSICFTVAFCWDSTTLSALRRDSFPLEDILQLFLSCSVPVNCSWDQHLDERSNLIWHLFGQYTTLYIFVCLKWRGVHLLM